MSFYETRELHTKEAFRTHWYQCTYDQMKKALFDVAEDLGYSVVDVNDTFKEILLEGRHLIIVKVTSFNKYEQGIDFNITTKWLLDLGRGKTLVNRLYAGIAEYVKFKGVSLHP